MVLPRPILLSLELVPADLRLRLLEGALGEGAAAAPCDQACGRGVLRALEQGIRAGAIAVASDHQPLGPRLLARRHGPHAPHGKVRGQPPAFRVAYLDLLPRGPWTARQGAELVWPLMTQHPQPRAWPSPLALLLGHAYSWLAPIHQRVRWHLRRIRHGLRLQGGPKLAVPPIE